MKRTSLLFAFLLLGSSLPAHAEMAAGEHPNIGVGFHNIEAPVGVRWWFSGQKVGADVGLGFSSRSAEPEGFPDEQISQWAIDLGVPFVAHSWHHAHVLVRPGILYESEQVAVPTTPPGGFDTSDQTRLTVAVELEAEVFLVDNISLSASTGLGFVNFDPVGGDNQTSFATIGNNFTTIGFHMYFLGGNK